MLCQRRVNLLGETATLALYGLNNINDLAEKTGAVWGYGPLPPTSAIFDPTSLTRAIS